MEITKVCFKCGIEKPLSEFYKHPKMADGHLNKCKECAKRDVRKDYLEKSKYEEYMEKERARGREKYHRLGYANVKTDAKRLKEKKYASLRNARRMFNSAPPNTELHHWNYNIKTQVVCLDKRVHRRVHQLIEFNLDLGYYFWNGQPLDTIEKHLEVVKFVCERDGFDYSKVEVLTK